MKKLTDEEIKAFLNDEFKGENISPLLQKDAAIYQQLFEAMRTEPETSLPINFSSKIVAKIQTQKEQKTIIIQYLLLSIMAIPVIALGINIINAELLMSILAIIAKFKWVVVFSVAFFYAIQYLDGRFVRRPINFYLEP